MGFAPVDHAVIGDLPPILAGLSTKPVNLELDSERKPGNRTGSDIEPPATLGLA